MQQPQRRILVPGSQVAGFGEPSLLQGGEGGAGDHPDVALRHLDRP